MFGITDLLAWAPGPLEWVIILIVALLLFGKRLPEVAKGMGKSLSEFKKGIKEGSDSEVASKPSDKTPTA